MDNLNTILVLGDYQICEHKKTDASIVLPMGLLLQLLKAASYLSRPGSIFLATNLDAQFPVKGKEVVVPGRMEVGACYSTQTRERGSRYSVTSQTIVRRTFCQVVIERRQGEGGRGSYSTKTRVKGVVRVSQPDDLWNISVIVRFVVLERSYILISVFLY